MTWRRYNYFPSMFRCSPLEAALQLRAKRKQCASIASSRAELAQAPPTREVGGASLLSPSWPRDQSNIYIYIYRNREKARAHIGVHAACRARFSRYFGLAAEPRWPRARKCAFVVLRLWPRFSCSCTRYPDARGVGLGRGDPAADGYSSGRASGTSATSYTYNIRPRGPARVFRLTSD